MFRQSLNYSWEVVSNIFYFHPEPWANDPIWRAYFSDGLVQPPTRWSFGNTIIESGQIIATSHGLSPNGNCLLLLLYSCRPSLWFAFLARRIHWSSYFRNCPADAAQEVWYHSIVWIRESTTLVGTMLFGTYMLNVQLEAFGCRVGMGKNKAKFEDSIWFGLVYEMFVSLFSSFLSITSFV